MRRSHYNLGRFFLFCLWINCDEVWNGEVIPLYHLRDFLASHFSLQISCIAMHWDVVCCNVCQTVFGLFKYKKLKIGYNLLNSLLNNIKVNIFCKVTPPPGFHSFIFSWHWRNIDFIMHAWEFCHHVLCLYLSKCLWKVFEIKLIISAATPLFDQFSNAPMGLFF